MISLLMKFFPLLTSLGGKIADRFWPDKGDAARHCREMEAEEMKRFKLPPKVLLKYLVVALFALCIVWIFVRALIAEFPALPAELLQLLGLADQLFGLVQ